MNIDILIGMALGVVIGANVGFVLAGLFGGIKDDEEMPDQ